MKILVTGGAGFIGSNLSVKLIEMGHEVFIADDLSTGSLNNVPKKAIFYNLDLSKKVSYKKLPNHIEAVFHLASQVSSEVSFRDPVNDIKRNSLATLLLLQWCKSNFIKNFIYTSTMGVYCDLLGEPATEKSKIKPKSFYGIGKRSSEQFIQIFSEEGMNTAIFRLFNVYGPGQNMDDLNQGMVSIYLEYILRDKAILVKGPLNRIRDFVFIDDVVEALVLGLRQEANGEIFNVCSGEDITVEDLINKLLILTNKSSKYPIKILPRTPRDINECYGSYEKAYRILGWKSKILLEDGLKKMIYWLK